MLDTEQEEYEQKQRYLLFQAELDAREAERAETQMVEEAIEAKRKRECSHDNTTTESRILEEEHSHGHPGGPSPADHEQIKICMDCGAEIQPPVRIEQEDPEPLPF